MLGLWRAPLSLFDLSGTASRKRAWVVFLICVLVGAIVLGGAQSGVTGIRWAFPVFGLCTAALATTLVQRLHDAGRSGFWVAPSFIPYAGILATIAILCLRPKLDTQTRPNHPLARNIFRGILLAVVLVSLGRVFWAPYWMPSGSMKPSLLIGDYFVVSLTGLSALERGDILVFRHPVDGQDYVKRLIGLPGDRVQMRDGKLFINDSETAQEANGIFSERKEGQGPSGTIPRCPNEPVGLGGDCRYDQARETFPNGKAHDILNIDDSVADFTPVFDVPEGLYFFMGDNRDNSLDSRFSQESGGVGFVPFANLIGRADRIMFSSAGSSMLAFWTWRSDRYFKAVE